MAWSDLAGEDALKPGRLLSVHASPHQVLLYRDENRVYALNDRCPHKGGRLSEGRIEGDLVVCPLHEWKFKLATGELPGTTSVKVRTFPVKVEGGRIWVDLPEY